MDTHRCISALCLGSAASIGSIAMPALADLDASESGPPPLRLDLGAGSVFPLYVGAQAWLEGPWRLQAELEVGWMPRAYAYTIDDALQVFGVYPEQVSLLIREALDSSLVLRPSLGWRPFPSLGLELGVGYTYVSLGGGLSPREVIETVAERDLPNETRNQIPLHSTLHNLHVRAGWRFIIAERWVLRAWLEYLHCFASSSGIDFDARRPAGERAAQQIDAAVDAYLNGYYTDYVKVPLVGAAAAYRF